MWWPAAVSDYFSLTSHLKTETILDIYIGENLMQGIGYSGDGVAEKTTQGC